MSVSCGTGTAAVESEGAAFRLEAVFLCALHTFVHLWALAHVEPFWSHPTHATKGYRQWYGCPQPLAPLVSPGGGLGPRCCATCASASGDFPLRQSRRTLTGFSTCLQNNTCGRSKDASTEVCPTGAHCGQRPWLCYGSGVVPNIRRPSGERDLHADVRRCATQKLRKGEWTRGNGRAKGTNWTKFTEIRTKFVRNSYEFHISRKFTQIYSREIRTKFVRNSYEFRTNFT